MAWLGESFANIKGQITNFTKEVLAESQEEREEFAEADELKTAKKLIVELENICTQQKNEIEHLGLQAAEFREKSEAYDRQSKSIVESYQKLIHTKDEENKRLREQVDEIQKQLEVKNNECAVITSSTIEPEEKLEPTTTKVPTCDATTVTDDQQDVDQSYVRELEERCGSYQNDLYVIRGELMTLQSEVDQTEEASAKLSEQIFQLLHSDFIIDGQPALSKLKHPSFASTNEEEKLVLVALRQLASLWRDLVEKKGTLERTVTKLSAQDKFKSQDPLELEENEKCNQAIPIEFFPAKVDSFGLETIEEERGDGDDDGRGDGAETVDDEPSHIAFVHKPKAAPSQLLNSVERTSSSTQTEENEKEDNTEILKAQLLASIELTWLEKERNWIHQVEERETRIRKLGSDLERLKTHLVDLEEQYTSEALVSEEKEKQLRLQIAELQKEIAQTLQQNERHGDVRDEVVRLTAERDLARSQSSSLEEQLFKLNTQLQNLHFVLEQFQKEKDAEIAGIEKSMKAEMSQLETINQTLRRDLEVEKGLLEKAKSGLEAAQQLNLQIEEKTRSISQLKTEVQEKGAEVSKLKSQMEEVANNLDGKIDRYLVKNLIVGYFGTPADKRKEVLRVIATVLDFNREDRQKTGLESTSLWPFRVDSSGEKQSLSEAFIQFLESESQPKVELRIPVEEMTRRNSRSSGASGSADSPASKNSSSSVGVPEMSMSLPVLNQADRSNSILKDVLNPRS